MDRRPLRGCTRRRQLHRLTHGSGDQPVNVVKICMWTWVCTPPPLGPDNHANAAGYGAIAGAFPIELGR